MSASRKGSRKVHFSATLFACCEIPARGERIPKDVTQMAVGKKLSALSEGNVLNNALKKQLCQYIGLIEVTNAYIGMNRELETHLTLPISDISETLLLEIETSSPKSSEAISKAIKDVQAHLYNGAENIFRRTLLSLYNLLKEEEEQKSPTDDPYTLLRKIYSEMLDASPLMSSEDISINTMFLINMAQVMNMLMKLEKKQYIHTKRDRSSFASIQSELSAIHKSLEKNSDKQKTLLKITRSIQEFILLKNIEILDEKLSVLKQNLSNATDKTRELIEKLIQLRADKDVESRAGVGFYQEINYLLTAFRMSTAAELVCQLEDRHMSGLTRLKKEGLATPAVGHIILLANEIIEEIVRNDASDYSGEGQYSEISDEETLYFPDDEDVSAYTAVAAP
ncbi:MAG TPA: hypothetical protein VNC84_01770 [Gammaproteobacteria bacterium]|jgi:hypothetical protein|nr:hypothetical protein [Gammaproteobacteria bacterium]